MTQNESPLAKFTYGTFEVKIAADKPNTVTRTGHRLGGLAAVRHDYICPECDKSHTIWAILNVDQGAYPAPNPIFRTLDDAANFILDVVDLHDWSKPMTLGLMHELAQICVSHDGIPTRYLRLVDKLTDIIIEALGFRGLPKNVH